MSPSLKKSTLPRGKLRSIFVASIVNQVSQIALVVENPPVNAGYVKDVGSGLWSGIYPGGGHSDQYSPVFLPVESHGQRSVVGYSP